jgi:LysM repeat protein
MEEFEKIYPVTYKVKKGETLIDIAQRREIFNDKYMWPFIYKANRDQMRDPQLVYPGQVLSIPRDLSFEEIIEARKQAKASPPYIPPSNAYNPEFYRRYIMIVPEYKDVSKDNGTEIPVKN